MNILIFEDDLNKSQAIESEVYSVNASAVVSLAANFQDFMRCVLTNKFDLIITDLIAPQFKNTEPVDLTQNVIEAIRHPESINSKTQVIALTRYEDKAEANFKGLNINDIAVVTFSEDSGKWRDSLKAKIVSCAPPVTFDFVIVCALDKEVEGYQKAGYQIGATEKILGFECKKIDIGKKSGVIVKLPRMGLVTCSIVSALAIDIFKPQLICMSGICAGIDGKANIYDVVIPDACHQHDAGKWGDKGLESEIYNVQIPTDVRLSISALLSSSEFNNDIKNDIRLNRSQIPQNTEYPEIKIFLAPASSGSSVVADADMAAIIKDQHRKNTAFEMESFALYEAARLSRIQPKYFSAKAVVDNGSSDKSDSYHSPACIIAAKTVYNLILRDVGF